MNDNKTILIIVDMQNDFIDGVLGTPEAKAIVPLVCEYVKNFEGDYITVTQDYHFENSYSKSIEGKNIPLHCCADKEGFNIQSDLYKILNEKQNRGFLIDWYAKNTFGSIDMAQEIALDVKKGLINNIIIIGLCTDICVISNALILRATCPNTPITVLENLCAGSTPKNHQGALNVMTANCINVKTVF